MNDGLDGIPGGDDQPRLPMDWYSIYQWRPISVVRHTESVAAQIEKNISKIELATKGLRQRSFRVETHTGEIDLRTPITHILEKRLLRAMFNLGDLPNLGRVVDYEVPLQETNKAGHGDIDLLCVQPPSVFCVEAKKPGSPESVLKAILQAYTYASLVATRREAFLSSFGLDSSLALTPAVLTFANSASGRQLVKLNKYPVLLRLVGILNDRLRSAEVAPLRFFIVKNDARELETCLTTTKSSAGLVKAVFCETFTLSIVELPQF